MSNLITYSRLASLDCPRKQWYLYEWGIRPKRTADPLWIGSAYHRGLELVAKGEPVDKAVEVALQPFLALPEWANTDELVAGYWLNLETINRMIRGHAWRYGRDNLKTVVTELSFEMALINPETGRGVRKWRLAGVIDCIVELPDGRCALVEYKTTSDDIGQGSDYWRHLTIDHQISLYMYAARRLGYEVHTVLYDVAKKPGIRPRKLKPAEVADLRACQKYFREEISLSATDYAKESVTMWGARFTAEIVAEPDKYFARQEIPRLQVDLDQFEWQLYQYYEDLRDRRKKGRYPQQTHLCQSADRRCVFRNCCYQGHNTASGIVPDGYVKVDDVHPELHRELKGETK